MFDGQVGEQVAEGVEALARRRGTTRAASPVLRGVHAGAAELGAVERLAGERLDHAGPADEGVGVLGHHDVVGQAEQERRARHDRTGRGEQHRDEAGAARQRAAAVPQPCSGGDAVVDVGAARRDHRRAAGGQRPGRARPPRRRCGRRPPTARRGGARR